LLPGIGVAVLDRSLLLLAIGGREVVGLLIQQVDRRIACINDDAIAEGNRLASLEREIKRRLFRIKHMPPERICGEQAIAACMPVRWITNVARVIEDGDRNRVA